MSKIPFFIGVVMIMPSGQCPALIRGGQSRRLVNGHGVGTLLYAHQAILDESIKDDMCMDAFLYWVGGEELDYGRLAALGIETILRNTRYVSIEGSWYRIRPLVRESLLTGAGGVAGQNRLHGSVPPLVKPGILVTLFGEGTGILGPFEHGNDHDDRDNSGEEGISDMAIVVERLEHSFYRQQSGGNPLQPAGLSAFLHR